MDRAVAKVSGLTTGRYIRIAMYIRVYRMKG